MYREPAQIKGLFWKNKYAKNAFDCLQFRLHKRNYVFT